MSTDSIIVDGLPIEQIVEAILFASTEPLPVERIVECIQKEDIGAKVIHDVINALNKNYQTQNNVLRIVKIAGGYQFATHPQFDKWVSRLFKSKMDRKLSQSSLEVLAIIAYRQPIARSEIEKIRGVNADWTLRSLMEKNLVTVVGREDAPGRPLLFGTTKAFLEHFGLYDISELPKLKEIEDILREDKEFADTLELDFGTAKSSTPSTDQPEPAEASRTEESTTKPEAE